jgi:hypothetical protein
MYTRDSETILNVVTFTANYLIGLIIRRFSETKGLLSSRPLKTEPSASLPYWNSPGKTHEKEGKSQSIQQVLPRDSNGLALQCT